MITIMVMMKMRMKKITGEFQMLTSKNPSAAVTNMTAITTNCPSVTSIQPN